MALQHRVYNTKLILQSTSSVDTSSGEQVLPQSVRSVSCRRNVHKRVAFAKRLNLLLLYRVYNTTLRKGIGCSYKQWSAFTPAVYAFGRACRRIVHKNDALVILFNQACDTRRFLQQHLHHSNSLSITANITKL